MSIIIRAQHHH